MVNPMAKFGQKQSFDHERLKMLKENVYVL